MQKLGVVPGSGFRGGFEVGGECVCVWWGGGDVPVSGAAGVYRF